MITSQVDNRILIERLSLMAGTLFGRGASDGEVQIALKAETGQLAGRFGDAIGPATKDKASKQVESEIKQQLTILPRYSNADFPMESETYADFTWLYASPQALVGINDEDNQLKASGEEALKMLRAGQKSTPRGKAWVDIGKRGKQHIMRLNRVRISAQAFNYVRRSIMGKMGMLRAAAYSIAVRYVPSKRIPAWVADKIPAAETSGKSRVNEINMGTSSPVIEFTIFGKGLESNPRLVSKLQGAMTGTAESMRAKLQKLSRGAKYIFETGQVYFDRN